MLATRITDRIPSAMAAMQILDSIGGLPGLVPGDLAPYIPPQPIVHLSPTHPQPISPQPRRPADPLSQMRTVAIAPADAQSTQAFPTTYPQRRGEIQVADRTEFNDHGRDQARDQPQDDWLWTLVKLPGRILMWGLKGLWMGIKAIDWVMTWVWRAILIVMLLAGGAVASYLWKTGQEKVVQVEEQVRSPQVQFPGIPNVKFPEIQLPELKMPELNLPKIEVPELKMPQIPQWNVTKSKNCAETIARFEQSGLSKQQFYGAVDKKFRAKHPELAGRGLTDAPEDAPLRQEWCAIADQVLNDATR